MSIQAKKFRNRAILYGVCAVVSIILQSLPFVLIFAVITALYVWLFFKHKDDAENPIVKKVIEKREEMKKEKKEEKEKEKTNKQRLNARIAEIEKDFEFDYGDEDDEE